VLQEVKTYFMVLKAMVYVPFVMKHMPTVTTLMVRGQTSTNFATLVVFKIVKI
jgi:hypothetical protein